MMKLRTVGGHGLVGFWTSLRSDDGYHPEISLIFAHGVGSLKELWDVPCPSPTGEPFGPRGGVVPTRSAREALRALLLDVVSIQ